MINLDTATNNTMNEAKLRLEQLAEIGKRRIRSSLQAHSRTLPHLLHPVHLLNVDVLNDKHEDMHSENNLLCEGCTEMMQRLLIVQQRTDIHEPYVAAMAAA